MTTTKAFWVAAAFAAATFSFTAAAQPVSPQPAAPAAAAKKTPPAVVMFLDRGTVLRQSAAGKNMTAQVAALAKKMETDFAPEGNKLQADLRALQNTPTPLPAAQRQARIKDLETRRAALQKKVQDRQAAIQAGLANARTAVEKALSPILQKILNERGANLLLDRGLVVVGGNELDITPLVIQRLDVALPKVVVTPVAPSAKPATPARPPG